MINEIINLLPSSDLKAKIKATNYQFTESELKPFSLTGDSFPKIVVRHDIGKRFYDDNGVLNIGVIDFLLDDSVL